MCPEASVDEHGSFARTLNDCPSSRKSFWGETPNSRLSENGHSYVEYIVPTKRYASSVPSRTPWRRDAASTRRSTRKSCAVKSDSTSSTKTSGSRYPSSQRRGIEAMTEGTSPPRRAVDPHRPVAEHRAHPLLVDDRLRRYVQGHGPLRESIHLRREAPPVIGEPRIDEVPDVLADELIKGL